VGELSIDLRVCGDIVVVVFVDHLKRTSPRSKMIPVYDASERNIGNELFDLPGTVPIYTKKRLGQAEKSRA